jgi:hypothetical protein
MQKSLKSKGKIHPYIRESNFMIQKHFDDSLIILVTKNTSQSYINVIILNKENGILIKQYKI